MQDKRKADFLAGWDARLGPLLTDEWQSANAIADELGAKQATVLARLKDMMRRGLVERRIVKEPRPAAREKAPAKAGRARRPTTLYRAEFRRPQSTP